MSKAYDALDVALAHHYKKDFQKADEFFNMAMKIFLADLPKNAGGQYILEKNLKETYLSPLILEFAARNKYQLQKFEEADYSIAG